MLNPLDLLAQAEVHQNQRRVDPVKDHLFSSDVMRDFIRSVAREVESYLQAANSSGKTTIGSLLGVCLARGIREIDGRTIREARSGLAPYPLALPRISTPNVGLLIVSGYKQSTESTLAAYRHWLGEHPHKIVRTSSGTSEIYVKPDSAREDSKPESDWSHILIFPADGILPRGIRADWAHADEMPGGPMWREVRARVIRGRPMYRWITATPDDAALWAWVREDYEEYPAEWKRNFRLRLDENQALTSWDIKRLKDTFSSDPLFEARWAGEYVDLSGENPWKPQWEHLTRWELEARDAVYEEQIHVLAERLGEQGVSPAYGTVYFWEEPVSGEKYYVVADPSLGIKAKGHDPCGLHVYAEGMRGARRLVARYNGHLGAYGLGSLAAALAERYHDALVDMDMTGGYGGPMLTALGNYRSARHPHGYTNLNRDLSVKTEEFRQPYGFTQDQIMKAEMIECVRWALMYDLIQVPSVATVKCLKQAQLDMNGRLKKPVGVKYEDFTCLGRFAFRCFQFDREVGSVYERRDANERFEEAIGRARRVVRNDASIAAFPWTQD